MPMLSEFADEKENPMKPMPEAKWPPRIETAYSSFYGWNVRTKEELSEPVKEFSTTEYLSRAESEHLLSEAVAKAVREAKAEVYQLKGKINATWEIASRCKQNGPTRDYGRALERDVTEMQARLEELISAVEEQA